MTTLETRHIVHHFSGVNGYLTDQTCTFFSYNLAAVNLFMHVFVQSSVSSRKMILYYQLMVLRIKLSSVKYYHNGLAFNNLLTR